MSCAALFDCVHFREGRWIVPDRRLRNWWPPVLLTGHSIIPLLQALKPIADPTQSTRDLQMLADSDAASFLSFVREQGVNVILLGLFEDLEFIIADHVGIAEHAGVHCLLIELFLLRVRVADEVQESYASRGVSADRRHRR